jgi:hypothetical protein
MLRSLIAAIFVLLIYACFVKRLFSCFQFLLLCNARKTVNLCIVKAFCEREKIVEGKMQEGKNAMLGGREWREV